MEGNSRVETILLATLVALVVVFVLMTGGYYLVEMASAGNSVALAILIVIGVLLIGFVANLSTLVAIFANQKQDNKVVENTRQAQDDALQTMKMLAMSQKIEAGRQAQMQQELRSQTPPKLTITAPEPRYLDSGNDIIEGLVE